MTIVSLLLLLQAGSVPADRDVLEEYRPYRQCLVDQGRPLAVAGRTDPDIVEEARGRCLASNLGSGSAALFALMKKGATKEQALERGARLREEIVGEALAILRGSPEAAGQGSVAPPVGEYRMVVARPASAKGPLDIAVPNAIVDLHDRYVLCQDEKFDAARVRDTASFRKETERAISACAAEKAVLKRAAEVRLAGTPDHADPARRQAAIAEAFDGYDRVRRAMAAGRGTGTR